MQPMDCDVYSGPLFRQVILTRKKIVFFLPKPPKTENLTFTVTKFRFF